MSLIAKTEIKTLKTKTSHAKNNNKSKNNIKIKNKINVIDRVILMFSHLHSNKHSEM